MTDDVGFLPGVLVFLAFCGVGLAFIRMTGERQMDYSRQVLLFLTAYGLRFGMSVVIYVGGLVSVLKDEDASGWTGGVALYNVWQEQGLNLFEMPFAMLHAYDLQQPGPAFLRQGHCGYYFALGALFFITNSPFRMVACAMNGFFGSLTVLYTYRIAQKLFSPQVASRAGWMVCFFPSMIIWSAITIKEPIVLCLESFALYNCLCLRKSRFSFRSIFSCIVAILLLPPFRFYAAWMVGMISVFSFIVPDWSQARPQMRSFYKLLTVFLMPFLLVGSYVFLTRQLQNEKFDANRIQSFRTGLTTGGEKYGASSGVINPFDTSTPHGLVLGTAFGAVHLLLAPFPWQLGGASLRMAFTLPELLYWWYIFFREVVPGTLYVVRNRLSDTWPLFFFLAGFGVLYSAMFGNVGLVFRHRAQLLPIFLVLGAFGHELRMEKRLLKGGRQRGRYESDARFPEQNLSKFAKPR